MREDGKQEGHRTNGGKTEKIINEFLEGFLPNIVVILLFAIGNPQKLVANPFDFF